MPQGFFLLLYRRHTEIPYPETWWPRKPSCCLRLSQWCLLLDGATFSATQQLKIRNQIVQSLKLHQFPLTLSANVKPVARNLGAILDSYPNFEPQIKKGVQSCSLQIAISKIKPMLSHSELETEICALTFSRLDYCTSLLSGIKPKVTLLSPTISALILCVCIYLLFLKVIFIPFICLDVYLFIVSGLLLCLSKQF